MLQVMSSGNQAPRVEEGTPHFHRAELSSQPVYIQAYSPSPGNSCHHIMFLQHTPYLMDSSQTCLLDESMHPRHPGPGSHANQAIVLVATEPINEIIVREACILVEFCFFAQIWISWIGNPSHKSQYCLERLRTGVCFEQHQNPRPTWCESLVSDTALPS